MRDSLNKLVETCETKADTMESFIQGIEQSGWLRQGAYTKFSSFSVYFANKNFALFTKISLVHCCELVLVTVRVQNRILQFTSLGAPDPTPDQGLASTLTVKIVKKFLLFSNSICFILILFFLNLVIKHSDGGTKNIRDQNQWKKELLFSNFIAAGSGSWRA